MKVVILSPGRVFLAGAASALLALGCMLGILAAAGILRSEAAEAVEAAAVGEKAWYFAEGYTGPGFEMWLLLYNPSTDVGGSGMTFTPQIRFYGADGFIGYSTQYSLAPGERVSVNVNQVLLDLYGYAGDVSIVVESSTYPFICERALYFDYKGQITGGSQTLGYTP